MRLGEGGGVRKDEKVGEGWNVIGWEVGKETERERDGEDRLEKYK